MVPGKSLGPGVVFFFLFLALLDVLTSLSGDSGMVASSEVFTRSGISSIVKTDGPEGGGLGCSTLSKTVDGVTRVVSFARLEAAASIIPAAVVAVDHLFPQVRLAVV